MVTLLVIRDFEGGQQPGKRSPHKARDVLRRKDEESIRRAEPVHQ